MASGKDGRGMYEKLLTSPELTDQQQAQILQQPLPPFPQLYIATPPESQLGDKNDQSSVLYPQGMPSHELPQGMPQGMPQGLPQRIYSQFPGPATVIYQTQECSDNQIQELENQKTTGRIRIVIGFISLIICISIYLFFINTPAPVIYIPIFSFVFGIITIIRGSFAVSDAKSRLAAIKQTQNASP